jgi:chromosome partitioning protein
MNLAAGLALSGLEVLLVDLDAQGNSTSGLAVEQSTEEQSLYQCLMSPRDHSLQDLVKATDTKGLYVVPSAPELSGFEVNAAGEIGRENRLKRSLSSLTQRFDLVIIDTPPSLGLLTVNAFSAGHEVLVPMQPHPFAFDGLENLLDTLLQVREQLNPELELGGIVLSMHDPRKRLFCEIANSMQSNPLIRDALFESIVRQNVALAEAPDYGMHIFEFAPDSNGARDFLAVTKEFGDKLIQKDATREVGFDSLRSRILQLNRSTKARKNGEAPGSSNDL